MSCLLPFFRKITHAYQPTSFQDVFSLPASSSWSLFYFNTSNAFPLHILHKIANFYSFVCATRMPFMDCHRMQDTGKSPTLFTRFWLRLSDSKVQRWVLVSHEKFAEHRVLSSCSRGRGGDQRCFQQALVLCAIGLAGVLSRAIFWGIFSSKLSDHSLHDLTGH